MTNFIIFLQALSIAVLFLEILYISFQRPSKLQIILSLLCFSTMVMMIGYFIEITGQTLDDALRGALVAYIGKPLVMLFSLMFINHFCASRIPKKFETFAIIYHVGFVIIAITTKYTSLFYSSVGFDRSKNFSPLVIGHGPLYYVYMATTIAHLLVVSTLAITEYKQCTNKEYRVQLGFIFGMIVSGIAGLIIFLTGITKGYDTTMTGCFIGTLLLAFLFTRYRLFDALNLAQEKALYNSAAGLLVIDARGRIVYTNSMIKKLQKSGLSLDELFANAESGSLLHFDGRYYKVEKNSVTNKGKNYGDTIEVFDVTNEHLYSSRLELDVADRTKRIQHIQRSIIGGFAEIVEARDSLTGDHIARTGEYVKLTINGMKKLYPDYPGLNSKGIELLSDAAPLHDIGKIYISDNILLKPGKLTDEEYEIMKTHSEKGAIIIEKIMRGVETEEFVEIAKDVALYHHEKWNGKGYPAGLKGTEIPLSARIMAVADVYDALRSKRCYKEQMTPEVARGIIKEDSGKYFDPFVAESFLAAIEGTDI